MEGNGLKGEGAEGGVARLTQVHDLEIHVFHLYMTIIAVLERRVSHYVVRKGLVDVPCR